MRRPIAFTAVSLFLLSIAAGCGGDDGASGVDASATGSETDAGEADAGGGGSADAAAGADAGVEAGADAGAEASALGRPCTGGGQGDCPDGYDCIPSDSGPWCTLRCEDQNDTSCEEGYDGPGHPACILTVTINDETFRACTVVCEVEDERFEDDLCPSDDCDGTCPGELACTNPINNVNGGEQVGSSCE